MQILIVDDSKAMRMIIRRALRQAGFDCSAVEASNGAEALQMVKTTGADLILCDWNMPEMNGLDLLRALKDGGHEIGLGFVTSESTPEMRHAALQAGALFLLTKPFTPEKLQQTLDGLVQA